MVGLIVARSTNNVIGKNGQIPWKIKGEQRQFKELTTGNIVVMGRKSYEEIGHPLPNRKTIVVSKSKRFEAENLTTVSSIKEAIKMAGNQDIYIAGGYCLYKEAIPLVDKMYITEIHINVEDGDVFKFINIKGKYFVQYKCYDSEIIVEELTCFDNVLNE